MFQIHIGRGQRLSSSAYSNILINSRTPCQFVGNTLTAVFGEDILVKSTVTGRKSNRNRADLKKETDEESENDKFEKLDPFKLQACEGNSF